MYRKTKLLKEYNSQMTKKLSCAIYEDYTKQIKSTKWKNILKNAVTR